MNEFNVFEKKAPVKNLVIAILAEENSLTARQLNVRIDGIRKVSTQGLHKALKELVKQNILVKEHKEYDLNQNWLKQLKEFSEKTLEKKELHEKVLEKRVSKSNLISGVTKLFNAN